MSRNEKGSELPGIPPSQVPNRVEILAVSGQDAVTRKTQLALFAMVRDNQQQLIGLEALAHSDASQQEAESPLLDAFMQGYRAYRG